jgi:hypothetical protein
MHTLAGGSAFPTAWWTLVIAAADSRRPEARSALVSLCEAYWYPLYAYVRRRGYPADQAQDLTQEFFIRAMEGRYLDRADPEHYSSPTKPIAGGLGGLDIWVSWRANTHDIFGWESPVNLGTGVNSPATDGGPSFFENDDADIPQLYMTSSKAGGLGGIDIYVSALVGGLFQPPTPVSELNTAQFDLSPSIRHDGLEIAFVSDRPGGAGGRDLWSATRSSVNGTWSTPVNLGVVVNSASGENTPSLSADRTSLFLSSDRPGGFGSTDLCVSVRQK